MAYDFTAIHRLDMDARVQVQSLFDKQSEHTRWEEAKKTPQICIK